MRGNNNAGTKPILTRRSHHSLLAGAGQRNVRCKDGTGVFQRVADKRVNCVPLVLDIEVTPFRRAAEDVSVMLLLAVSVQGAKDKILEVEELYD